MFSKRNLLIGAGAAAVLAFAIYMVNKNKKDKEAAAAKAAAAKKVEAAKSPYEGKLIHTDPNGTVYLVENNKTRVVPTDAWENYFNWGQNPKYGEVVLITTDEFNAIPSGEMFTVPA